MENTTKYIKLTEFGEASELSKIDELDIEEANSGMFDLFRIRLSQPQGEKNFQISIERYGLQSWEQLPKI